MPPSNASFLDQVVAQVADGSTAVVCSKPHDPGSGGWIATAADDVDRQCPPGSNNYFNCSSFVVAEDGSVAARKEAFSAFHVLVLDDVGTKVDRSLLEAVTPTWEIETSPGNSQMGFVLAEPMRDPSLVERLQKTTVRAGLCDAGAIGLARWMRLPHAINGKARYRDGAGKPFACRLVAWHPDRTFTVDALTRTLGLNLDASASAAPATAARAISTEVIGNDIFSPAPTENPVVTALRDRGLYKRELAPGRHDVTCPWTSEHTDAVDDGTVYFEPDADHPRGGFKCHHSHGERYHIGDLIEHLGVKPDAARGRARIIVAPGEINRVKRAAERSLALKGGLFHTGDAIVSIRVDVASGIARVEPLSEAALGAELSDAADWYRFDVQAKAPIRIDPNPRHVAALYRAQQYEYLPPLRGIARQPFFRDDGSLVTEPGYDPASGRFGAFSAAAFTLPEPTEAAARQALETLQSLLGEFRFATEADRAAALSAMLTAAVRPSLAQAPAFNITASTPGSGKSYLASTIVPFAGPGHAAKVSYPTTAEEASKAMLSALLAGPAAIVFDDMQTDWKPFGALNRMLTSDTITDRMLGTNRNMTASTRSLILGTGNNVMPLRDMGRRVVTIRLHHRVATPALETYAGLPAEAVAADRGRYVSAALTIVRAWKAAGSPRSDLPSIASYGEWSDLCRQPLVWLGLPDPAASLVAQISHDPDQDALTTFLRAWHSAFGDSAVELRKLIEEAIDNDALRDALDDLPVIERDTVNRSKLGWYLKKNAQRVAGGFELERVDNAHRTAWRVIAMPS